MHACERARLINDCPSIFLLVFYVFPSHVLKVSLATGSLALPLLWRSFITQLLLRLNQDFVQLLDERLLQSLHGCYAAAVQSLDFISFLCVFSATWAPKFVNEIILEQSNIGVLD